MFTGIITARGEIVDIQSDGDWVFTIATPWNCQLIDIGASIACSGVCLTVTKRDVRHFIVAVSAETLSRTSLGRWKVGSQINLERALKVGDELGGHIVSGHVDCLAQVTACSAIEDSHRLDIEIPAAFAGFVAEKGSVCLDGVSLTVNEVGPSNFNVNIIDHTWQQTTLGAVETGSVFNMEIDMLARYMSRLMQVQK